MEIKKQISDIHHSYILFLIDVTILKKREREIFLLLIWAKCAKSFFFYNKFTPREFARNRRE
jgi:hypothetical protein